MKSFLHRYLPSGWMVVAVIALLASLTGGAVAAVKLPANSVGTSQIKRSAVTLSRIAPSAQTALKGATGPKGADGAQGPQGIPGLQGVQGIQGERGPEGPVAKVDGNGNIDVATAPQLGDTNTIRIGTATQTQVFIPAIANGEAPAADPVMIDLETGRLASGGVPSSRRLKRDIHPLRFSTNSLMKLQPLRYRYRKGDDRVRYGLVAEDVAKVFPDMTVFSDGRPVALHMEQLPTMLLAQVQRQQRQIATLERRIAQLENR